MDGERPNPNSPEHSAWREEFIRHLRERSRKSSTQLRKEFIKTTMAEFGIENPDSLFLENAKNQPPVSLMCSLITRQGLH